MFYAAAGGALVAYSGRTSTIDQTGGTRRAGVCTTTSWMPYWAGQSIGLHTGPCPSSKRASFFSGDHRPSALAVAEDEQRER